MFVQSELMPLRQHERGARVAPRSFVLALVWARLPVSAAAHAHAAAAPPVTHDDAQHGGAAVPREALAFPQHTRGF